MWVGFVGSTMWTIRSLREFIVGCGWCWCTTVLSCVSVQDVARESLASGITNQPMTTEKDNNVA